MTSPLGHDGRRARLHELAAEWGVRILSPVTVVTPHPPIRSSTDDFNAEELLKRRRQAAAADKNSQGGLKRAFSSTKKTWEAHEVFEALEVHVSSCGAPAVADALIGKLLGAGGNLNVAVPKNKPGILSRRKSLETLERSRILQKAIELRQVDMVAVLVQYADPITIDSAVAMAIRSGDAVMLQLLLARGANLTQTQDAQDAFRNLCILGGRADLVGLVLQSGGRPSPNWVSMSMVDAARKGCLETVLRLSQATADGDYNKADALRTAIAQCRVDIALAILTGAKPPTVGEGLMQAFIALFEHPAIHPNQKLALTEALLCAGAAGEPLSRALSQACATDFYDMVELLVAYGASVEFQGAAAVRHAVSKANSSLVQLLLSDRVAFSPLYASECVGCIPKAAPPEVRHAILNILLRKGAKGAPLNEALIDAVRNVDLQTVQLLLTPVFPAGQSLSSQDLRNGARTAYERHEVASVDFNNGAALATAVGLNNLPLVKLLLAGKPSGETRDRIFPQVLALHGADRYHMAECFLVSGISRPRISAGLQGAIEEQPPRRDEHLISMLLRYNADVNFNDGAGIVSAIASRDLVLLERLLTSKPTAPTMSAATAKAMTVDDQRLRYEMMRLLIAAGAGREGDEVSQALQHLLSTKPIDVPLTALIMEQGLGNANFDQGLPVALAANDADPNILELILQHGNPNAETLYRGLDTLMQMPTTPSKVAKVDAILRRTKHTDTLNMILVKEVQTLLETRPESRNLAVVSSLLAAGADVNSHKALALCRSVKAADAPIVDLLLTGHPQPSTLAVALPHSLAIANPMDRLAFTQKLIDAGAPHAEANRALVYAINAFPQDLPLIRVLAAHAESTDGEALITGVKSENVDIVSLVLDKSSRKYPAPILRDAFEVATKLKTSREKRLAICRALLERGVSGNVVSEALLAAASDGDIALGEALLRYGASVEHKDGQSIIEACGSGALDVVKMLFSAKADVGEATLTKGFQAAAQVGDLAKREGIFRLLLNKGSINSEAVDAQLVDAAKHGTSGETVVRLLLEFGANVDHNSGEGIWNATRSGELGILKLMLGVEPVGARQKRPTTPTLLRALKASRKLARDPRYQAIDWLFKVGLSACEEVDMALQRAVKEEPDLSLVELLLANGGSPTANGCAALTDAAQMLLPDILGALLSREIPEKDVSWAFQQAFTPATASKWLSEPGLEVARMLLNKGAQGESLCLALDACITAYGSQNDAIARQFANLLLESPVDVDFDEGLVLQQAAKKADSELIEKVLRHRPNSISRSMAFPYIFDAELSEEETLRLVSIFTDYQDGEDGLDVMFAHPKSEPVVFRALNKFPRSVKILQALLDTGYYHDQTTMLRVMEEIDVEEQVTLLFWALFQPQKRISSGVIEHLIDHGANINFETRHSKTTPLMLAIQARRHDLVKTLILAGAEVDVVDATGNTPMTMATNVGGELGTAMMSNILAADPSRNDGSLHNAARELNLAALRVLVEHEHDVDFPSPLHGGRSALGEVCLNAAQGGTVSAAQEKQMEKVMKFLIEQGSDLSIQSDGKSVLLLALHSRDPVSTTRALLKVGVWKLINQPFNHYTDGTFTYSATQYVTRVLPETDTSSQVLELLRANRGNDVYYANEGAQPEGAVGLPPELLRAERERKAREERIAKETEEHSIALARSKEIAQIQNQIFMARAELEDSRARRQREEEMNGIRSRQALEEESFASELRRRKAEREAAMVHEQRLTEAGLTRARLVADAELEMESRKQERMIEWDQKLNGQKVTNAKQLSAIRIKEREAVEKIDQASDARTVKRIAEHRKLVEGQSALATKLAHGGVDQRRQIGYVTGELD